VGCFLTLLEAGAEALVGTTALLELVLEVATTGPHRQNLVLEFGSFALQSVDLAAFLREFLCPLALELLQLAVMALSLRFELGGPLADDVLERLRLFSELLVVLEPLRECALCLFQLARAFEKALLHAIALFQSLLQRGISLLQMS